MTSIFDGPYFKVNKFMAQVCGVWPYQSKMKNFITFTIFALTGFSFLFALLSGLMQEWSTDVIIILETLVIFVFVLGGTVNNVILYTHQSTTKFLYERILKDWREISDINERAILEKHTKSGQDHIVVSLLFLVVSFIVTTLVPFLPRLLEPTESTGYSYDFPYYCHCLIISQAFQHYQVFAHFFSSMILINLAYMAFSRTFIANVRHVCALYAIARYRLENVMKPRGKNFHLTQDDLVSNLISAIREHNQAISYLELIENTFSGPLFVTEFMGLACMAILIFDIKNHLNNTPQVIRLIFMLAQFCLYLLTLNATGEQVLKSCDDFLIAAYFIEWYKMPLKARKFLLMIMIRAKKRNHLTAASLVTLSMETYAMVIRTSWSFATVLLTALNEK
ncbi:uncharacterized protein LOC106644751 [Copidosoma floridanum]|uniref:uncharacterized protein LOC106644751 n=1 Tax=Copidosoma floridanum TaxID=29053 RepID=UPI0006C944D4|nr:uncharacterized protein LOC106644751 [Copidosoma floridanum]